MSYLAKYISGEYEQVWDELQTLGAAVREEPLYTDALAVAREMMTRARHNLELIVTRLKDSGYIFFEPIEKVFVAPEPNAQEQIQSLERIIGIMPLSIRAWYEIVGEVDLSGSHPSWQVTGFALGSGDEPFRTPLYYKYKSERNKLAVATEPLQIEGITKALAWAKKGYPRIVISPHLNDRSNFSGGGVDVIPVPDLSVDGLVVHEWEPEPPEMFVDYLRRSFAWGGFPGFAEVEESLRPTEMLEYLKEGLLPI